MVTGESPLTVMDSESFPSRHSESGSRLRVKGAADIQQRLIAYKKVKPLDVAYYVRVVREAPARAVDLLLHKDMLRDEEGTQLVAETMPELTNLYAALEQNARTRIDERVRQAGPCQKGRIFANEVLREVGRVNRRTSPRRHDGSP